MPRYYTKNSISVRRNLKTTLISAALLASLLIVAYLLLGNGEPASAPSVATQESSTPNATSTPTKEEVTIFSFTIADQSAGKLVAITDIEFEDTAWIAIYETREDGTLGNILGAARFYPGSPEQGGVPLLRATEPNHLYYAVIHRDDGDFEFDHKRDTPYEKENGERIASAFQTF